jgi:hypothetical protein
MTRNPRSVSAAQNSGRHQSIEQSAPAFSTTSGCLAGPITSTASTAPSLRSTRSFSPGPFSSTDLIDVIDVAPSARRMSRAR